MATTTVLTTPAQPDIQYAPDIEKWKARTQFRLQNETLKSELPPGFPKKLESDLVWEGETLKETYDWIYELNEEELDEIERALVYFKCNFLISFRS